MKASSRTVPHRPYLLRRSDGFSACCQDIAKRCRNRSTIFGARSRTRAWDRKFRCGFVVSANVELADSSRLSIYPKGSSVCGMPMERICRRVYPLTPAWFSLVLIFSCAGFLDILPAYRVRAGNWRTWSCTNPWIELNQSIAGAWCTSLLSRRVDGRHAGAFYL